MVFDPLKLELNVTARVSTSELPLSETVLAAMLIEHWLFCRMPVVPTTALVTAVAASFSRLRLLVELV